MKILVLISGNGTNLQALIDNIHLNKEDDGIIVGVISNNAEAYGLTRAEENDIPTNIVSMKFPAHNMIVTKTREVYEQELLSVMNSYNADLIVLAGWMYILGNTILMRYSDKIINLHPALPGSFVGANCIKKAWDAYRNNEITETGIMTHWVIPEVDKGDPIQTMRIPIVGCDNLQDLKQRINDYERDLLVSTVKMIINLNYTRKLSETSISPTLLQEGKVREIYDIGNNLLAISHSDRLSSFDRHICNIPNKGEILTATSAFWFHKIKEDLDINHHYIHSKDNVMIVKKCEVFPIEVVVRGYITGNTQTSLWTHYKNGTRNYCGITFPDGLKKNQKLECNVITPTTKGEVDELITPEEIIKRGIMTQHQWNTISQKAMRIFEYGQQYANERGLILVDTKYEFGTDIDGNILLIDEVHTCDSSRYWIQNSYKTRMSEGMEPEKYDKDIIRDYIKKNVDDPYNQTSFEIEPEQIKITLDVYRKFYTILTTKTVNTLYTADLMCIVQDYYENHHWITNNTLVILSGSVSDENHVKKIVSFANKKGLYTLSHVSSAHKNTHEVLRILDKYNAQFGRIIFVTVAGRSNALSGVIASNTKYPTIACPPFKDKLDMSVNINSTLQCPSKVPVMTILEPENVVLAAQKIFGL